MKLLLTTLNSKYVHANLALRYLYGAAFGSGLDIEMKEFTINNEMGYIYGEILRGNYDAVCFSTYIWNISMTGRLCSDLKKARPSLKIFLGGPEVSFEAVEFLKENLWADGIFRGEGELPFLRFCQSLAEAEAKKEEELFSRKVLEKVSGLVFREYDGTLCEVPLGEVLPMEQLPFPYALCPIEKDKVVYYESSRGCPYRCSYCISSLEKTIRPLPMERVREELAFFLAEEVKQVKFIDRTFNYDRKRAGEIWQYLMDHDNGVTNFHFEICAELLDDTLIGLLAGAREGLFQFEIGIQSTHGKTLAAVDRSDRVSAVLSNVRKMIALGNSHIHVDLIAGLPYEDYKTFGASFNDVYRLGADNLQLGFLKLLKGTKVRLEAEEHDYVFRDEATYEVISNRYLSAEELVRLKMIEHVLDLYANKGGFKRTLDFLAASGSVAETPFAFYEKLAAFFYESGYQHRSHKKEDLYRILNRFAEAIAEQANMAELSDLSGLQDVQGLTDITGSMDFSERVRALLEEDLAETMNFDAVKKFHKKGWEL